MNYYLLTQIKKHYLVIFLMFCSFFFCVNSVAKSVDDDLSLDQMLALPLEDLLKIQVSVTSQFMESPLQTGSTSALITENEWQTLGARRLKDAIGNLPGTIVLPNWFGAEPIYIRGYASGNNTSGVATIIDGVSINGLEGGPQFRQQNINLGVLDRIEMIRGPGSSLYGENAFHGVLSLNTFESKKDVSRFAADYASNQFFDASVKHSQVLGNFWRINVAGAVSGQTEQDQQYTYINTEDAENTNKTSERELSYNTKSAVIKLRSKSIHKTSYMASYFYDQNNYEKFYSAGTTSSVASRDTGGVDSTFWMGQLGGKYKISQDSDVKLKLYYFRSRRTFDRSFQPFNPAGFVGIGELVGKGKENNYGVSLSIRQKALMDNTQWSLEFAAKRSEMGDYSVKQTDEVGTLYKTFPLAFSDYSRNLYSLALDAATRFYQNKFIVRYGFRFDRYSDFGNNISPRLGLIYQPTKKSAVKLLYGNAFRVPTAGEIKGFATVIGRSNLKPEKIDTFELVYAIDTAHTHQEYVLFRSFWNDAITNVDFVNKNTGENSAYGAEASFRYQSAQWKLPLSASYVRSENKLNNQDFVAFPQWIINAGVGYRFIAQKIDLELNNRVHLNAKEGQVAGTLPDPDTLKNYWRADLHISKQWNKKMTWLLDVRNLFNRDNFVPSVQINPSTNGLPDESISVKIGLRYQL